jgi:hypothetical protein
MLPVCERQICRRNGLKARAIPFFAQILEKEASRDASLIFWSMETLTGVGTGRKDRFPPKLAPNHNVVLS